MGQEDQNATTTQSGATTATTATTTSTVATASGATPATAGTTTMQQDFDALVARKEALWARIKGNTLYEYSGEWKEIQSIDERLLTIWDNGKGGVTRKEDK